MLYPAAKVTNLPRCHSDHCPVLMEAVPICTQALNKPFRFQEFWLSDLTFPNIVSKVRSSDRSLVDAIDTFSKEATLWNRSHFGNIHHRKRRVLARIYGVQKALSNVPSSSLINLENQLQLELESILDQERDLWMLKSRINWMIQGDRNTSFYHISALTRRKRNHIASVKDERGQWITDGGEVREHFRKGFVSLYTTSLMEVERVPSHDVQWQVQLPDEVSCSLDVMVTLEEIKEALWSMKPYKSPGPDGLHASFYQRFWLTVGDSVKKEVMRVFLDRKVPDYLNKTLIVLIPKIQGPESIGNYRPISLCNSVYKIISKVIVNRLRPHLENIVSPFQTAFISGRRGTDNVIIMQELIHTIGRAKGRKGYMAIKIDLEKAYDRIEWSFIREMLVKFNFPSKLTDIIMSCVSLVSTSLLFNGGCLDSFRPSRGIKQRDPLSPYLFILCMEYFGHLIEDKCAAKAWISVKTSRSWPSFSHLFFADDLVLFAEANMENCIAINEALQEFCARSGQKVSEAKSRIFFSPNVDPDQRDLLSNMLGFNSTDNLCKYLGFPLKHAGARKHDFDFVLDRVKKKFAGWKANLLSMAGRLVLIQASSSTIPNYVMQQALLPNKILKGIDRVNRNFLWGSSDHARKMHWVNWDAITKPKKLGGLGLQSAKGRNSALLAKLNWRFHTKNDAPWVKVLKYKYCTSQRINSRNEAKLPSSPTWKGMKIGKDTFKKGLKWIPRHESNLNFWADCWSNLGSIRALIQGPLPLDSSTLKLKDVISMGRWDWSKIPFTCLWD